MARKKKTAKGKKRTTRKKKTAKAEEAPTAPATEADLPELPDGAVPQPSDPEPVANEFAEAKAKADAEKAEGKARFASALEAERAEKAKKPVPSMRFVSKGTNLGFSLPEIVGKDKAPIRFDFTYGQFDVEVEAAKAGVDSKKLFDAMKKSHLRDVYFFLLGEEPKAAPTARVPLSKISVTGHDAASLKAKYNISTVDGLIHFACRHVETKCADKSVKHTFVPVPERVEELCETMARMSPQLTGSDLKQDEATVENEKRIWRLHIDRAIVAWTAHYRARKEGETAVAANAAT